MKAGKSLLVVIKSLWEYSDRQNGHFSANGIVIPLKKLILP